jgi:hypothetical protein
LCSQLIVKCMVGFSCRKSGTVGFSCRKMVGFSCRNWGVRIAKVYNFMEGRIFVSLGTDFRVAGHVPGVVPGMAQALFLVTLITSDNIYYVN